MRKRTFVTTVLFVMGALALVAACGSSSSNDASSSPPPAGSASVDTTGGVVEGAGVRLVVPAGAVQGNVTISIAVAPPNTAPPDGYVALSPIYVFSPNGLVFQKPVTVEIPLPSGVGSTDSIVWSSDSAGVEILASSTGAGVMTANVMHFSEGFIGHPTHAVPPNDQDSGSGSDASDGGAGDGAIDDGSTCHAEGGTCDAGSQCCSGSCNVGTCLSCKPLGASCSSNTDCCSGGCSLTATVHTCLAAP